MKKLLLIILAAVTALTLAACTAATTVSTTSATTTETSTTATTGAPFVYAPIEVSEAVLEEARLSFDFFWEAVNGTPGSDGYGMVTDRYNVDASTMGNASIAAVGYGLAAMPIGIENDWISYQEGYDRVLGTLTTMRDMQRTHGFFYHFVSMTTARRSGTSEVSIIDTAILICGAIVAAEYFGGAIETLAYEIYDAIEWDWYYDDARDMFYMGYSPESGFGDYWDHIAEQLMLYVLAAGSSTHPVGKEAYDKAKSQTQRKKYGSSDYFYVSYPGTLFTYQFSHAWIDFSLIRDADGYDWFDNSVQAGIAAYDYAQQLVPFYKTYGTAAWGNAASDGPNNTYFAYGNLPAGGTPKVDGTLAPYGATAMIVFTPDLSTAAAEHYAAIVPLQSKYGFRDAYNLGVQPGVPAATPRPNPEVGASGWFCDWVLGIDKGITLMMIEDYRSGLVWHFFMQSDVVQDGLDELGFTAAP